jgi:hypothetical protein
MTVERRYDPVAQANDHAYRMDHAYFKKRKDRFLALRRAFPGEFDSLDARIVLDGHFVTPPTAWVRVTRHPTLGMSVVMVWRGELLGETCDGQGYLQLETDSLVDHHIQLMRKQGCANWPEVNVYLFQLERAKELYNAQYASIDPNRKAN